MYFLAYYVIDCKQSGPLKNEYTHKNMRWETKLKTTNVSSFLGKIS